MLYALDAITKRTYLAICFPFLPTISLGKMKYTKLFYSTLQIVVHFFFKKNVPTFVENTLLKRFFFQ